MRNYVRAFRMRLTCIWLPCLCSFLDLRSFIGIERQWKGPRTDIKSYKLLRILLARDGFAVRSKQSCIFLHFLLYINPLASRFLELSHESINVS